MMGNDDMSAIEVGRGQEWVECQDLYLESN